MPKKISRQQARAKALGIPQEDVWDLDITLARWLLPRLTLLKETKHGIPGSMIPKGPKNKLKDGNPTKAALLAGERRWHTIMDEMIEGFSLLNTRGRHNGEGPEFKIKVNQAFIHLAVHHADLWD